MKRIALHFSVSCAVALLFLNLTGVGAAAYLGAFSLVFFAMSLCTQRLRRDLVLPVITCAVFLSSLLYISVWNNNVLPVQLLDGESRQCTVRIIDIPKEATSGKLYTVRINTEDIDGDEISFKAKLYSSYNINADYYDNVSMRLTFKKYADNGFDSYGDFGENIFISAYADSDAAYTVETVSSKPLNYRFIKLRERVRLQTAYSSPSDEGALALAFLTGDKSCLSAQTVNNFKICGIYHVMAVSGLHTSLICLGVYYLLRALGVHRTVSGGATFLLLLSYLAVADFSKSVTRSVIMVGIFVLGEMINKKADMLNSLGVAMAVICINPFAVTDPSAVLTVCAMLGIGIVYPRVRELFHLKSRAAKYIWDGLALTGSVMLTTLPASMVFFGSVSLIGFLINFIVIPLTELTLVSALLYNLLYFSTVAAFIPKHIMLLSSGVILKIAQLFADNLSFLYVDISDPVFFIAAALCFLFCGLSILVIKKINVRHFCIFFAVAFALSGAAYSIDSRERITVEVSENNAVAVYGKDCLLVIGADDNAGYYTVRNITAVDSFDKTVYLDCDYDFMKLDMLSHGEFIYTDTGEEMSLKLCDDISVSCNDSLISITVYDKNVYVYEDFVTVGDYKAFRGADTRFSDSRNYIFTFRDGRDTYVRREEVG